MNHDAGHHDPKVALAKLKGNLPEGYDALIAYLGENDTPFLKLLVPMGVWNQVRDQVRGWHWLDEVKATLPFEVSNSIDGFRIMLEWEMPKGNPIHLSLEEASKISGVDFIALAERAKRT